MNRQGNKLSFFLSDEEHTDFLGQCLGRALLALDRYPALLFTGPLGAGKTTLIRGVVKALPGGENAEVSSPSFNILNIYPTKPRAAHFDLYRMEGMELDPESEEVLLDSQRLIMVEWSEFLSRGLWPEERFLINIAFEDQGRTVKMETDNRALLRMLESISGFTWATNYENE